jgi:hypothetical protein
MFTKLSKLIVIVAPVGTIFEIHLPHRGEPLIGSLQSVGMNVIVNELEPMHFRLMAIKLDEIN